MQLHNTCPWFGHARPMYHYNIRNWIMSCDPAQAVAAVLMDGEHSELVFSDSF